MHPKNIVEIILRLTAGFIRQFRMLLIAGLLPLTLMVGGCAPPPPRTHGSKWECTGKCDTPFHQASAKCTAQANAVIGTSRDYKRRLQYNCLVGEGWELVDCKLGSHPDCL